MPGAKREVQTGNVVDNRTGEKDDGRFKETVRKLLETPPKPHKRKGSSEGIKDDGASRSRKRS